MNATKQTDPTPPVADIFARLFPPVLADSMRRQATRKFGPEVHLAGTIILYFATWSETEEGDLYWKKIYRSYTGK